MLDAHHHLWRYDPREYAWIGDGMDVLKRDFLVEHLRPLMADNGIEGLVTVQATQTVRETEWLLDLAGRHDEIRGVVGWVPLVEPGVAATIERLAANPRLRGVRHVLQDEPDDGFALREDFNRGLAQLRPLHLTYDILIYERHLPQAIALVDRHPNQVFVLDHVAKPRIRDRALSPWRERIRDLARREHVYCKISGMATEADWTTWTDADLAPYLDVVLEAFGPRRLMFGSDWPVLLLAAEYGQWAGSVRRAIAPLSADERAWIETRAATEAYNL